MFGLSVTELAIILVIVLIVFGAGKLPKVMSDLGKGVRSFKSAMTEAEEAAGETKAALQGEAPAPSQPPADSKVG